MWWSGRSGERGEGEARTTQEFSAALHSWELAITRASFVSFLFVVANEKLLPETHSDCKETRKSSCKETNKKEKETQQNCKQTNKQTKKEKCSKRDWLA
jgi:hypothetical protein